MGHVALEGLYCLTSWAKKLKYHISYHIVDLKRQNRLEVGTNKPKLKVKMQSGQAQTSNSRQCTILQSC